MSGARRLLFDSWRRGAAAVPLPAYWTLLALGLVLFSLLGASAAQGQQTPDQPAAPAARTSCEICHSNPDYFDQDQLAIVQQHAKSVHGAAGLSCHDCHGGNPDPSLGDDMSAMDDGFAEHPFVGAPKRTEIPEFCGRCHSDPAFMNRFAPDKRTDQEREYWTSQHGKLLRQGEERVATCIDCHGTHDIIAADDPEARTYPTRIAETCGHCHSDAQRMGDFKLPDGRPLPIDQYALWSQSVHANALLVRQDLSAPTCNDCHGNHGATPPGLDSIAFVCGQCHGRQAQLFRASPKRDLLRQHADFMADAGDEGCAACHQPPDRPAELEDFRGFGECDSCHGHHGVVRPSIAMLSPLPETPCAFCHEPVTPEGKTAIVSDKPSDRYLQTRDQLLASAPEGLDADRKFDWLVDQAQQLPFHTTPGAEGEGPTLRPEFSHLFEKFRIGKTHYTYLDPVTGEEREGRVRRCGHCHGPEPMMVDDPVGYRTAKTMIEDIRELTTEAAQAERVFLRARRGGVETKDAQRAIEEAVDSQIELEVLVHTFSTADDGPFVAKQAEGIQHAEDALNAAHASLAELGSRRRGLLVSLFFVVLLLVALGLKIRDLKSP